MSAVRISDAGYSEKIRRISTHNHDCYQIIFMKSGVLDATIAGKSYRVEAPALIFISFMESHSLIPVTNVYDRYFINIDASLNESSEEWPPFTVLSRRPENFSHVLRLESEEAEKTAEYIMRSIADEQAGGLPYSEEKKELLFRELLIYLSRVAPSVFPEASGKQDKVVWKVQRYLEKNHRLPVDNDKLAEEFHISKSYLSHVFKDVTGYSIHQYLINYRLSSARTLLRETNAPVTDIAFEVGFDDSSNFSRVFRRKFGVTPREFRNSRDDDGARI